MIDELMAVHTGQANKDEVFKKKKDEYIDTFGRINQQDELIKAANGVIAATWEDFKRLKQSVAIDPTRQQFFQRIDLSLMCQQDLENMLSQGSEFYSRLVEHLNVLKQNIQDYKMSRNMQMTDLCKQLGQQPPDFNAFSGAPGGGPPMPPPAMPPSSYEFDVFEPPK